MGGGFTPLLISSQCILQPQPTGQFPLGMISSSCNENDPDELILFQCYKAINHEGISWSSEITRLLRNGETVTKLVSNTINGRFFSLHINSFQNYLKTLSKNIFLRKNIFS